MTVRRWNILAGALLALAAFCFFWDADRPLHNMDEIWQGGEVAGMLVKHEYLVPLLNGQPHFDKPPLSYWLNLPLVAAVGNLQVGMRIVPGLCGLALLWLLYRISRKHVSPGAGLTAMVVFFLSYEILYHYGYKSALMEGLLDLELALIFWLNLRLRERPHELRWIGLLLGLTALTKTTFPFIPAVFTGVNLWWLRKDRPVPARLMWQGLLIAAAVGLPWFLAVIIIYGQPAVEGLITFNVWERVLGHHEMAAETGRLLGRREPLFVLQHYLVYGQPWSLLIWPALLAAWRERHTLAPETRRMLGLAAVWFGFVLVLFLLSRGRWPWYIFSIYFPGALLIAAFFNRMREPEFAQEYRPVLLALTAAACIVSPLLFAYIPYNSFLGPLDPTLPLQLLAACLLLMFFGARLPRPDGSPRPAADGPDEPQALALTLVCLAGGAAAITLAVFLSHRPIYLQPLRVLSAAFMIPVLFECGRRMAPAACGRMAFAVLVLVAASYNTAPLQFPSRTMVHPQIKRMERLIRQNAFADGRIVELPYTNYYDYVALAQTYWTRFDISYDSHTFMLTIKPRLAPAPGDTHGV